MGRGCESMGYVAGKTCGRRNFLKSAQIFFY